MKYLIKIITLALLATSFSACESTCEAPGALNFGDQEGGCQFTRVFFFTSLKNFTGKDISSILIRINGTDLDFMNLDRDIPVDCDAAAVNNFPELSFTFRHAFGASTDPVDWTAIFEFVDGSSAQTSGTVGPDPNIPCKMIDVIP